MKYSWIHDNPHRSSLSHPLARRSQAARKPLAHRPYAAFTALVCRLHTATIPLALRYNTARTPLARRPHAAHTPLTRRSHAARTPLARRSHAARTPLLVHSLTSFFFFIPNYIPQDSSICLSRILLPIALIHLKIFLTLYHFIMSKERYSTTSSSN